MQREWTHLLYKCEVKNVLCGKAAEMHANYPTSYPGEPGYEVGGLHRAESRGHVTIICVKTGPHNFFFQLRVSYLLKIIWEQDLIARP